MPRPRRRDWPIRVYAVHAHLRPRDAPPHWPEALTQVVQAQRDLWNTLVDAFQANRTHYDALLDAHTQLGPLRMERAAALQALDEAKAQVRQCLQTARSRRHPLVRESASLVEAARQRYQTARDVLAQATAVHRSEVAPQAAALLDALWQTVQAQVRAAPLPWYNARLIGEAFEHSVRRYLSKRGGPPQPRRGPVRQAHLTYHFTGPPLTWEQLFVGKTRMLGFAPVPLETWDETLPQSVRRRLGRTTGFLHITDTDQIAFLTNVMHRPPPGALVKGLDLVGREVVPRWQGHAARWRWQCLVLCEIPPETIPVRTSRRLVALDLGWRVLDATQIRVGMLYDGVSYTPLYFPPRLLERHRALQALAATIDTCRAQCKQALVACWQVHPLPPDLAPAATSWHLVGQTGLLRLLQAVTALPLTVPSRAPTLHLLTAWAIRTGKLRREWHGLSRHLDRAKDAWMKNVAAQLCRDYDHVIIEALDLKQLAARDAFAAPRLQASQQYRQLTAPSAFLARLKTTAAREGVTVQEVDPAFSTLTCPVCGAVLPGQDGEVSLTCPHGHVYDQDRGAAKNLFERALAGHPC